MGTPTGEGGEGREPLFIAEGVSDEVVSQIADTIMDRTHANRTIGEQLTWVQARTLEPLPKVKIFVQDRHTNVGDPVRGVELAWSESEEVRRQLMFWLEADDAGKIHITNPDGAKHRRLDDETAEAKIRLHTEWVKGRSESLAARGSSAEEELEWFSYEHAQEQPEDEVAEALQSFLRTLESLDVSMVHSTEQASHARA